jgi:hypothetical protein
MIIDKVSDPPSPIADQHFIEPISIIITNSTILVIVYKI